MMPDSLAQPLPVSVCKNVHCRYTNGGAFIVCPICKTWQHKLAYGISGKPWTEMSDLQELLRDDNNQRVKDWPR